MYRCEIKYMFNIGNKKTDEFTITEMAKYCNVSRQTIYNVIENKKEPTVSLAISILDFLNEKINKNNYITWYIEDMFKNE